MKSNPKLDQHVAALRACALCPRMQGPPVSGGSVASRVFLVGQAPGDREPILQRPFAWTAGKTLFRWFAEHTGIEEEAFRKRVYIAAVCRCFPGKNPRGGDRVPAPDEIGRCSVWLETEMRLLDPQLILPVGKLAISRFLDFSKLTEVIGRRFRIETGGAERDIIPLPHPSGASTWHRAEPGRSLTLRALEQIRSHPAFERILEPCA
jgi:uracil-DNA glycosylase